MDAQLIEPSDLDNPNSMLKLKSTNTGRLMAHYCLAFETMKWFVEYLGTSKKGESRSLIEMIGLISGSKELEDVKLRTNEKAALNVLNNNGKESKKESIETQTTIIRNILKGKVKSHDMKINVLVFKY